DRLAELAARLLGAVAAQVSLLTDVDVVAGASGPKAGPAGATVSLEESLAMVVATSNGPLVAPDARADPRVCDLPSVSSGHVRAYLGVPLTGDDGTTVGALSVIDLVPRRWSGSEVAILQELAASVVTELELAALARDYEAGRARWESAIDAGGIGTFDLDVATGVLSWDDRMIELFGYDRETFDHSLQAFTSRLHPDDLVRVMQTLDEALASGDELDMEYRVLAPGAPLRWVHAHGRVVRDATGAAVRVLGTSYDATDVRAGEARVARVLEAMSAGFISVNRGWVVTYVNAEGERMLGRRREELVGQLLWDVFPETTGTPSEADYRRAMETQTPVSFDIYRPPPLDVWHEVRAWPSSDGLSLYFLDVTAQRSAQREAQRTGLRTALLAQVASELTGTLDAEEAVARLARLVVPALGDWSIVTLVDDDPPGPAWTRLRDIGWWHADPDKREQVRRYANLRLGSLTEDSFLARALSTGRRVSVPVRAAAAIAEVLEPGEARELVRELAPESVLFLPLRARGRILGVLSVFRGREWPGAGDAEVDATAVEVADRVGLALDSARLYTQQRRLAEALQRSLLTAPPQPDHLEVAVRYEPAAEAAQVGGDWYDAFLQADGSTVLVIGDVLGHDTAAAVAMGQVRGLLRGIAVTTGEGPARVLTRLDEAMEVLRVGTIATVVVARLEQTADEVERGVTRLRWSNAGHPPPMSIDPDGTVRVLGWLDGVDPDLLLGIDPKTPRTEFQAVLERGATVLLYTDGLVERRDQSIDEGLNRLRGALSNLAAYELDDLCDAVLVRMLPADAADDVAIAAVRLHRQDAAAAPKADPEAAAGASPDAAPGIAPETAPDALRPD
ncbi:MAG TPA: SpoIIE family protein phosphatase, partial [Actinomycetales bacterium]|nr:SpoIIE family protein phosphatase [Actinomycetales bacterium]